MQPQSQPRSVTCCDVLWFWVFHVSAADCRSGGFADFAFPLSVISICWLQSVVGRCFLTGPHCSLHVIGCWCFFTNTGRLLDIPHTLIRVHHLADLELDASLVSLVDIPPAGRYLCHAPSAAQLEDPPSPFSLPAGVKPYYRDYTIETSWA